MVEQPTFGDFILGVEGLAILRSWMTDTSTVKARSKKIVEIAGGLEEAPWANPIIGVEPLAAVGLVSTWLSLPTTLLDNCDIPIRSVTLDVNQEGNHIEDL